jgi:leucyl aminopeptidase
MNIRIYKTNRLDEKASIAVIATKESAFEASFLSKKEFAYVKHRIDKGDNFIEVNQFDRLVFIIITDKKKSESAVLEEIRKAGCKVQSSLTEQSYKKLIAFHAENYSEGMLAFAEGAVLGSYRFLKYQKSDKDKKNPSLKEIGLICQPLSNDKIMKMSNILKALYKVRDLVNEPLSFLTAIQLSAEFEQMGSEAGFDVEVFNKKKIESLKMGGLIAVNKGSVDPPTFTVMEWKHPKARNSKPYILIGKGVVYDTGGLSLKPTSDSMDYMKSDMSGGAIVAGVMYCLSSNDVPLHVIGLVPATDNRPSGNAYAPGDIITLMDGTNVEMLNSDAEGRMILADALVYARKYKPGLVIDVATLTGSAAQAIGSFALVAMGTASSEVKEKLSSSGIKVFERIVEFPLWEDYAEMLKSDIADIKNVGGKQAGAITGGKFLERFTAFPWMHFDIAGVAFSKKSDSYRGKGGTGFGMRLLYEFLSNHG